MSVGEVPAEKTLRVGIDENGLGPRLGPLVVTGVLADVKPSAARWFRGESLPASSLLGDSKMLVKHGDVALAEAWARALCPGPSSPKELIEALCAEPHEQRVELCPDKLAAQCWGALSGEGFIAPDSLVQQVQARVEQLRGEGLSLRRVTSQILCAKRLRRQVARFGSLLRVDLEAMELVLLALHAKRDAWAVESGEPRELAEAPLHAVCGKVGGLTRYLPSFVHLSERLLAVEHESALESRYTVQGIGRVSFLRDADSKDPLVAVASLVGKYLREQLMGNVVSYYRAREARIPSASGYHDPRTEQFVRATQPLRQELRVPDECFFRKPERGA